MRRAAHAPRRVLRVRWGHARLAGGVPRDRVGSGSPSDLHADGHAGEAACPGCGDRRARRSAGTPLRLVVLQDACRPRLTGAARVIASRQFPSASIEWLILTDSAAGRASYAVPQVMLIVVSVLAVFWRVLAFPFLQDDWQFVYDFAHLGPWTVALGAFDPVGKLFYRPIGVLYFATLYQLFGLHVGWYHVVALAI